uniref:heat stress transcription factor A-5 n=1 Tax=Erigeron canadensis TaxID=72917 RepID=UPI001CB89A4F|nr:heat stress transcription factor A-5 [Erigeron canadensis]
MDGNQTSGGGGGGGPAPFLLKTYDMVDDSMTDEIVSWSTNRNSFVVWNPPEFARLLLPTYFKHNNFSSFIRQLNTYGFRKIDPERWEFANEEFMKDNKHLLKNIHRRKPIHSHSTNPQSSTVDPERAAFDEEIDKLTREKSSLEKSVMRFKQQQPATKLQLEDLTQRVNSIEQKQDNLLTFLKKASQNPEFVKHLSQKLESMDFSADNKKRRLPQSQVSPEDSLVDNHSPSRPDSGNGFHHDFSNKLTLELSPSVSDVNFVSNSTQSSNEDGGSPRIRLSENYTRNTDMTPGRLPYTPETQELSDTCTSFAFNMESSFMQKTAPNLAANEEPEGHLSCQLNLTLASSVSQIDPSQDSDTIPQSIEGIGKPAGEIVTLSSSNHKPINNAGTAAPTSNQPRVNDVFWEQFLTERPGSSDIEDASSNLRAAPSYDQEDIKTDHGSYENSRNFRNLTL